MNSTQVAFHDLGLLIGRLLGRAAFRNNEQFHQLAYRLFLGRYGRSASRQIRQFREVFSEFSGCFEEFVQRCPGDLPAAPPACALHLSAARPRQTGADRSETAGRNAAQAGLPARGKR